MRNYLVALFVSLLAGNLAQGEVQAIDDEGNTVRLDAPTQRIVSLAPHITEMLFAAGVGERIVATVRFSDYPEASKSIPKIGSYKEISMESLINLNPDLVIAWPGSLSI